MPPRFARITCVPFALTVCIVAPAPAQQAPGAPPLDAAAVETNIREALASRIDTAGVGVGTTQRPFVVLAGAASTADDLPPPRAGVQERHPEP